MMGRSARNAACASPFASAACAAFTSGASLVGRSFENQSRMPIRVAQGVVVDGAGSGAGAGGVASGAGAASGGGCAATSSVDAAAGGGGVRAGLRVGFFGG